MRSADKPRCLAPDCAPRRLAADCSSSSSVVHDASERMIVLSPIYSDAATIAASSEVATLPATNLQTMDPKRVWRTDGETSAYLTLAFDEPVTVNMLAFNRANLSGMATVRIRGAVAESDVTASPLFDTGARSPWPSTGRGTLRSWPAYIGAVIFDDVNTSAMQYFRIDYEDPGSTDGYLEIGRQALGELWQPSTNFDFGGTPVARVSKDVQTETDYGQIFTDRRHASAPRRLQLQISALSKFEVLNGIAEIMRLRGLWGDVFVFLDPAAPDVTFQKFSLQGVFTAPQEHQIVPMFDADGEMFSVQFPVREVP
jgi:hypothetical protein